DLIIEQDVTCSQERRKWLGIRGPGLNAIGRNPGKDCLVVDDIVAWGTAPPAAVVVPQFGVGIPGSPGVRGTTASLQEELLAPVVSGAGIRGPDVKRHAPIARPLSVALEVGVTGKRAGRTAGDLLPVLGRRARVQLGQVSVPARSCCCHAGRR